MFIRCTQTRATAAGATYFTYRLVRSERLGDKVRQRTLLNLGRDFEVSRNDWPVLCRRIEEVLSGQMRLLPDCPSELEVHAQHLAAQLLARHADLSGAAAPPGGPDVQKVNVDSLELIRPRSGGVEHVGLWAMDQLGLRSCLHELGMKPSLCVAAIGSIIARMACPGSERDTRRWLGARSALDEMLGVDFATMGPMKLDRASDALMAHREAIEHHLFNRALDRFDLQPTVTLYDLTNTFFEGGMHRQPGDQPTDCPLLTLGLVLDGSGFVRRSQVFAGNVHESHTLAGMLDALNAPHGALVVMDRGSATEDHIQWLREQGYRYLVVNQARTRHFDAAAAVRLETASSHGVQLHKELSDDAHEVRLYCFSEKRTDKERDLVERFAKRFEDALTQLSEGFAKPRAHKRVEQTWKRIARLRENSRGIAQYYDVQLDTDETGQRATAVRFTRRPLADTMMTHHGVYCLRSSETDWDEATLWRTYSTLTDLEAVFCSLKSEPGLRPIYHHKPIRAEGHLFITVIAYQLVQLICTRLRQAGEEASWTTLRRILEGQQRITATFRRTDGATLHVRKATCAETPQQAIYDALGIDPAPGEIRKTIV